MKALVFLCLLIGSNLSGAAEDTCLETSGVCGCCLLTKQLDRMSQFFTMSYDHLTEELNSTKLALNNIRASRSVFSATLNNPQQDCNTQTPSSSDTRVIYNNVMINQGGNYNSATGIFTAPRKGVYNFAVTLYNLGNLKSCAALMINGVKKYTLMEKAASDTQDSASLSMTFSLEAGDRVYVDQPASCVMCAHDNLYNTFTGFLLYATA